MLVAYELVTNKLTKWQHFRVFKEWFVCPSSSSSIQFSSVKSLDKAPRLPRHCTMTGDRSGLFTCCVNNVYDLEMKEERSAWIYLHSTCISSLLVLFYEQTSSKVTGVDATCPLSGTLGCSPTRYPGKSQPLTRVPPRPSLVPAARNSATWQWIQGHRLARSCSRLRREQAAE